MAKITWFKEYVQSIQDEIDAINRNKVIIEKDQLVKFLNSQSSAHNLLLIGLMPDFGGKGNNADEFKLVNITQFMVLKKTTYSEYDHDAFVNIYEETYVVLEQILNKLLKDSRNCTELRFLNTPSIKIEPVFNLASCNGWKLMFNFDMFV